MCSFYTNLLYVQQVQYQFILISSTVEQKYISK